MPDNGRECSTAATVERLLEDSHLDVSEQVPDRSLLLKCVEQK